MLAVPRKIITHTILIASLLLPSLAQAVATDVCFNFLKAQEYARAQREALVLIDRNDLKQYEHSSAYWCLGDAYYNMGRASEALLAFQQVERLSQTTKDLGLAYNKLHNVYYKLKDIDRAELYSLRAIKASLESGAKATTAVAFSDWATIEDERGDDEQSSRLSKYSLALLEAELASLQEIKKPATLNTAQVLTAQVFVDFGHLGNFIRTEKMLRQAIEIDQHDGNAHGAAQWQIDLGDVLIKNNKLGEAEKELAKGLAAIRLIEDKRWEAAACKNLAKLALTKKKPANGLRGREWLVKAEALYRELGDTESENQIANFLAGK